MSPPKSITSYREHGLETALNCNLPELEDGRLRAAPARLLSRGPANNEVRGLLKMLSMAEPDDGLVVGRTGRAVEEEPGEDSEEAASFALSRVFESQQTAPFSHKLGGSLITTDGLEQNADISPGKQTPGHLSFCLGALVVVGLVVVEVERTVEETV